MSPASNALSSPAGAALQGALRFGAVSLAVFATVAFGERWMYRNLGLGGAYGVWTLLFVGLGAFALGGLAPVGQRVRFYWCFALGFLGYAIGWIAAYFLLRSAAGEWVGSVAGSILMAAVFALGFGRASLLPKIAAIFFVANSVGYFAGSALNDAVTGQAGMLLWGALYGLGLGAGLGLVLRLLR
jgi:hypothetical protein